MDKLFIHLTGEERVQCLQVDEQGSAAGQPVSAPLQEMAGLAQGKQVVVLVPAERLVLTRVAVPTSSRQRQLQAVPYLLEDLLAEDVEQLHFALGSYRKGEVAVAVSAHEQMRRWLQRLAEGGIRAKSMLPDVLALPFEEGTWSVALAEERALVRTGRETGFCCDSGNLSLLLGHALQQAGEAGPASLRLFESGCYRKGWSIGRRRARGGFCRCWPRGRTRAAVAQSTFCRAHTASGSGSASCGVRGVRWLRWGCCWWWSRWPRRVWSTSG